MKNVPKKNPIDQLNDIKRNQIFRDMLPKENIKSKTTSSRISNNVSRLAKKRKTVSVQFLEFICTLIFIFGYR